MNARAEEDRLIDRNGWALAWLAFAFGVTMIVSHIESAAQRFGSASWHYALLVPGSPATWGVVILTAGLLLLYAAFTESRSASHSGFFIGFIWFCALDATAVAAFVNDLTDSASTNTVNPLSVLSWTYLAWMYGSRMRLSSKCFQGP